jgi:glycosyltransferase involved in cell wall biosynthesis
MMSGAALVCTDIGGHSEYAVNGRHALMVEARNPREASEALVRILRDDKLRCGLAVRALEDISRFTWKVATDRLEAALSGKPEG